MAIIFEPGPLPGLFIIRSDIYRDERGWFAETWRQDVFAARGISDHFVQENRSLSRRGALRGLHFQRPPHAQAKLFSCIAGSVWDVVVDLRRDSPGYGRHFAIELVAEEGLQLYIPGGFAHGFVCLSETALTSYKCDSYWRADAEGGLLWSDPDLAIPWPSIVVTALISPKDRALPTLHALGKEMFP
jgi:dTDP-4-dehydrorhamnose 3,5-epimerase